MVAVAEKQQFFNNNETRFKSKEDFRFPDGININHVEKVISKKINREYFLFGQEGSKIIFSKAPLRGNTPYGFWIDYRLEEIIEEIKFFNKIDQTEEKSNMLNILLTVDRNGLGVNQEQTWNIFKDETSKYLTRVKRILQERFKIDVIGHFRVFEAHRSGHCHCHIALILNECIDFELIRKYNPKTDRSSYCGEIKDQDIKKALSGNWYFSGNKCEIGKDSVSCIYSTDRLINYLTKYYAKNQTFIQNSFSKLFTRDYNFQDDKDMYKLNSDMKKVFGFYFAVLTNVRLFRHSIKAKYRQDYLNFVAKRNLKLIELIKDGKSISDIAIFLGISEKRVVSYYRSNSVAQALANEQQSNLHEDFSDEKIREYFGIMSKENLGIFCEVSKINYFGLKKNNYSDEGDKEQINEKSKGDVIEDYNKFFQTMQRKDDVIVKNREVLEFKMDLSHSPVMQGYIQIRKTYKEVLGKELSIGRFLRDFYQFRQKIENELEKVEDEKKRFYDVADYVNEYGETIYHRIKRELRLKKRTEEIIQNEKIKV